MIFEHLLPRSFSSALLLLLACVLLRLVVNKYGQGLNRVPGPWAAGFTDLWRLFVVRGRRAQEVHIELHKRYGPVVRLGPRAVSIGDPEAIKIIYSAGAGFSKSSFYPVQQALAKGKRLETMFNTANEAYHAKLRRSVSNAYAMSTLVTFESFVDSTSTEFLKQLKLRFANRSGDDGICDFGAWLQYYAFDVIGELTYSKRLGFVEKGIDIENIIRDLERFLDYVSWAGQIPFLDRLLMKNPAKIWLAKHGLLNASAPVAEFAKRHITERQREEELGDVKASGLTSRRDFLNRFREARAKNPDFITEQLVLALTVANMFAGSDTTGITMRAAFYFLLKHPSTMEKLLDELSEQSKAGKFARDDGLVQWEEVRSLPYLSAVINESLRCHPAVGLTLERIVPPEGVTISGHALPGGMVVGCSAWVVHQDTEVFGNDAAEFRPERWIESSTEKRQRMNNCLFSFGAGARTCIGKNISLLELYKLIPTILRIFEVELVNPDSTWELHNAWFVKQKGLLVRLKEREVMI
ncbi:cytochrome P450 [Dactylonectria estremocensis]|uniref:Cytochrome P450 n=1 Tax=Dactylonectria estremocensis TaxID=1079267 RepID=A0A9P9EI34_9HYPO|nr:cytochrome P450 [Dactylonectria estremocensis]